MVIRPTSAPCVLASDIDGTLTGDSAALRALNVDLQRLRRGGALVLILSTGRRLDEVIRGFRGEGIPVPDAIVGQVGTEVYLPPFTPGMAPLADWDLPLRATYRRRRALEFLSGIDGLAMQPDEYNTPLKASCYLDAAPDPEGAARRIEQRVCASPDGACYQVVWSSGRHLDILPSAAGKGRAIRFVVTRLALGRSEVVVAGDSGNDWSMFEEFRRGIIVANAQPELAARARAHAGGNQLYFAKAPYAAGVAEGMRHFGLLAPSGDGRRPSDEIQGD